MISKRSDASSFLPITPVRAWWTVAVMVIFNIVSLIDRSVISLFIPEIKSDLGLNDFQIGLVQGLAFAVFYGVAGLYIGGLADRYSRRWIMYFGISIWSLAAAGTGLARNYVDMFVARMLVGAGEGAIGPSAQSLISAIFPRHRLSTPISLFVAAGTIGVGLSFALGGVLLLHFSQGSAGGMDAGLAPWRQVLIALGLPGLLIAFLAFTVSEPAHDAESKAADWPAFFVFFRKNARLLIGLLLAYGLAAMLVQGTMTWAPTYARRVLELSATEVGSTLFLIIGVGGVTSMITMGLLTDWLSSRGHLDAPLLCLITAIVVAIPAGAIGFTSQSTWVFYTGVTIMICGLGASLGPSLAAAQMIAPPSMRGRVAAATGLVANLGGVALGPILVGFFTEYLYRDESMVGWSMATMICTCGPVALLALIIIRPVFVTALDD